MVRICVIGMQHALLLGLVHGLTPQQTLTFERGQKGSHIRIRGARRDVVETAELFSDLFFVETPRQKFNDGCSCLIAPNDLPLDNIEQHRSVLIDHSSQIFSKTEHVLTPCRRAPGTAHRATRRSEKPHNRAAVRD